ncbi:MAG: hypothetical protein U1E42_07865 [Rhodospirillales bacterium]
MSDYKIAGTGLCTSGPVKQPKRRVFYLRSLQCSLILLGIMLFGTVQAHGNALRPGTILVTDALGGTDRQGALFVVNPRTGQRRIISDFGDPTQGPLGKQALTGVAVGAEGQIYVQISGPAIRLTRAALSFKSIPRLAIERC